MWSSKQGRDESVLVNYYTQAALPVEGGMEDDLLLYWDATRHLWIRDANYQHSNGKTTSVGYSRANAVGGFKLFSVPDAHQMKGLATTGR